jgi:hypothetical protein
VRAVLANAGLVLGSTALVLVLAEGSLRLAGVGREGRLATRRIVDGRWRVLLDCYPSNPRGYFDIDLRLPESRERYRHLAPHRWDALVRWHPWAVESRYSSLRFRDAELQTKPPGRTRVILLGDSFTEGEGVKEKDVCARVLGRLLESARPGRFEVRNCGRRGADFPELFEMFEAVEPFAPDVVVYALVLNDAVQSPGFRARQSFVNDWILDRQFLPDDIRGPRTVLESSRLFDFVEGRVEAWRVGRATTRWYLDMWGEENREGLERTLAYVREMDRRLRRRGARLLVAPWPLFVSLEGGYPFLSVHEKIRRFCLSEGIAFHDLLPVFRGHPSADFWVHPVDHHPNETAHRMAAESLAPAIEQLVEGP